MPAAIKRDHELASKGLVTIMLESQNHSGSELDAFVLQTWPDVGAMWTEHTETPTPAFEGIPHAALIGADGKLVWDGNPGDESAVEKAVQAELAKVQKGWGDDADSKKIRAQLYGKGDLAGARKAIDGLGNADLKAQLQAEAEAVFANAARAVTTLQGEGRWDDARVKAAALAREVTGVDEWARKSAELMASFDTPEGKKELEASRRLAKVEKQITEKKLRAKDGSAAKALKEAAKASEGTKAAERALMLAGAMGAKLT